MALGVALLAMNPLAGVFEQLVDLQLICAGHELLQMNLFEWLITQL
jgi:hypothetical protein